MQSSGCARYHELFEASLTNVNYWYNTAGNCAVRGSTASRMWYLVRWNEIARIDLPKI